MNVLVLTFDQLPTSLLGGYGNQWLSTPGFDRLACRSVVYDQHYIEDASFQSDQHAWWTGCYQFPRSESQTENFPSLFDCCAESGIELHLLAEATAPAHLIHATDSRWQFTGEAPEESLEQTAFSLLIDQAEEQLQNCSGKSDQLIWLKALGLAAQDLPPLSELLVAAEMQVGEITEEMLAEWMAVYAEPELFAQLDPEQQQDLHTIFDIAKVLHFDHQLGLLLDQLEAVQHQGDWLLIVTSGSGERSEGLNTGRIKTPLFLYDRKFDFPRRRDMLVQSLDIPVTILDWFGLQEKISNFEGQSLLPTWEQPDLVLREYVCSGGDGQLGLCTRDHFLRRTEIEDLEPEYELYGLPADPGNRLDLSTQNFEVTEQLEETLNKFLQEAEKRLPIAADFFVLDQKEGFNSD